MRRNRYDVAMPRKTTAAARKESYLLGTLLAKLAPKIGASVLLEPEWGVVGQITFRSGAKSYFRYNTLDLNPVGASDVAKDKAYATFFMDSLGYPTVPGKTFYSDEWCATIGSDQDAEAALTYAKACGFPLIVKPNSGSQGSNVRLAHTKSELARALRRVFKTDRVALVQKYIAANDYRIVVLDNEVISAYLRTPLSVVGDGSATIEELLTAKTEAFALAGRDTSVPMNDLRIADKLRRYKMTLETVPAMGTRIALLDNANLSTGGDSEDATDSIHPEFKRIAVKLTRDMGLRLCGVDLLIDGDISDAPHDYWVLEINAAPGLDHYVRSGEKQRAIVEDLYMKVLRALER